MAKKRDQIIDTTCQLMETQGYHATGLNQILEESGAPKGSLYYYFPDGKEELAIEAIERSSRQIEMRIRQVMAAVDDPAGAVDTFLLTLAEYVQASEFRQGGPITAIALEAASTNDNLRATCRAAYDLWQKAFEDKLRPEYGEVRAKRLAALIIAAIEGAIILCRCQRSIRPLQDTAAEMAILLHGNRATALQ